MNLKLILLAGVLAVGTVASAVAKKAEPEKLLRHVVMFKFKDAATSEQVKEVEQAFRRLPSRIKEIKEFEWGLNNSPEGLAQGFTHVFLVTFKSEADRAVYLPHPEHQAFVKILEPYLDKVLVIDYWAQK